VPECPVPPATAASAHPQDQVKSQKAGPKYVGVRLAQVISAGILSPPTGLFRRYKGRLLEATLLPDGRVDFQGTTYKTCSLAAEMARSSISGRRMNTNGWEFWQYTDREGATLTLADARQKFLERKAEG